MAIKVATIYYSTFNMPRICANCGSDPIVGIKKISHGQSDWSGKHTTSLSLDFPMCQKCYDLSIKERKAPSKIIIILGVLIAILGCFIFAIERSFFVGVAVGIGILFLAMWLSGQVFLKDFTPEDRIEYKNVENCVKILNFSTPSLFDKKGNVIFKFRNNAFGNEFSQRNLGKMV